MNFLKRIHNLVLLARCLARALFHGKANIVPKNISRIIVVPAGKLGDVVCTTPVLRAVRNSLPHAKLVVAGPSALHRALLADSGLADAYLELGTAGAVARIKECGADAAVVTGPTFRVIAELYLAGIPLVIAPMVTGGRSPLETGTYKILQGLIKTFPYRMGAYAPRERLRALEPLGVVSEDVRKHLGFSKTARTSVDRVLVGHGIAVGEDFVVGITPTAGHKIKEWPEERFAEIAEYVASAYSAKVIIIGESRDKEKAERMVTRIPSEAAVLTITDFNLDELKALIARLNLFISVDTGPIYIAEAFGVPTIDITGPIDEKEQPPRGPFHRNVVPPERERPQLFVLDARSYDRAEALRQLESITVPMVKREIDSLMASLGREKL